MRRIKKTLSILLSLAVAFSCMPIFGVQAENATTLSSESAIYTQNFEKITSLSDLGSEWSFGTTETTVSSTGYKKFTENSEKSSDFELVVDGNNTYLSTKSSIAQGSSIKLNFGTDNFYLGDGTEEKIYSVSFRAKIPTPPSADTATDVSFVALTSSTGEISPVSGFNHRNTEKITKLFAYYANGQGKTRVSYDTWHDRKIVFIKSAGSTTAKYQTYLNGTAMTTD